MPTRAVYGSVVEWERWVKCSGEGSVNGWIRRALNDQAALDEALRRQELREAGGEAVPPPRG